MRLSFVMGCSWALLSCVEGTCVELGCPPPIAITVLESELWTTDDYEIHVSTDEFEESCRLELRLNEGGGGSDLSDGWSCTRPLTHFEVAVDEKGRVLLLVRERAESVDITIEKNGSDWLSEELEPVYQFSTPSGPGCGECARADIEVER